MRTRSEKRMDHQLIRRAHGLHKGGYFEEALELLEKVSHRRLQHAVLRVKCLIALERREEARQVVKESEVVAGSDNCLKRIEMFIDCSRYDAAVAYLEKVKSCDVELVRSKIGYLTDQGVELVRKCPRRAVDYIMLLENFDEHGCFRLFEAVLVRDSVFFSYDQLSDIEEKSVRRNPTLCNYDFFIISLIVSNEIMWAISMIEEKRARFECNIDDDMDRILRRMRCWKKSNPREVIGILDRMKNVGEWNTGIGVMKAMQLTKIGCTDEAVQLLRKALRQDMDSYVVYTQLAMTEMQKGDYSKAIKACLSALKIQRDSQGFCVYARICIKAGQHGAALKAANMGLELAKSKADEVFSKKLIREARRGID